MDLEEFEKRIAVLITGYTCNQAPGIGYIYVTFSGEENAKKVCLALHHNNVVCRPVGSMSVNLKNGTLVYMVHLAPGRAKDFIEGLESAYKGEYGEQINAVF